VTQGTPLLGIDQRARARADLARALSAAARNG
jgi:hypothetical protein